MSVLLLIVLVAPFAAFAVPQITGADHSYVVRSSSMSPTIHAGDVVFVKEVPTQAIQEGDVITYRQGSAAPESADKSSLVTHRTINILEKDSGLHFQTKGDANEEPDPVTVPAENVVGRMIFSVPYLGWAIVYAGSKYGIFALIVVPMVLLIVTEVWDLVKAVRDGKSEEEAAEPAEATVGQTAEIGDRKGVGNQERR